MRSEKKQLSFFYLYLYECRRIPCRLLRQNHESKIAAMDNEAHIRHFLADGKVVGFEVCFLKLMNKGLVRNTFIMSKTPAF
jgi:hypothetical protein